MRHITSLSMCHAVTIDKLICQFGSIFYHIPIIEDIRHMIDNLQDSDLVQGGVIDLRRSTSNEKVPRVPAVIETKNMPELMSEYHARKPDYGHLGVLQAYPEFTTRRRAVRVKSGRYDMVPVECRAVIDDERIGILGLSGLDE